MGLLRWGDGKCSRKNMLWLQWYDFCWDKGNPKEVMMWSCRLDSQWCYNTYILYHSLMMIVEDDCSLHLVLHEWPNVCELYQHVSLGHHQELCQSGLTKNTTYVLQLCPSLLNISSSRAFTFPCFFTSWVLWVQCNKEYFKLHYYANNYNIHLYKVKLCKIPIWIHSYSTYIQTELIQLPGFGKP